MLYYNDSLDSEELSNAIMHVVRNRAASNYMGKSTYCEVVLGDERIKFLSENPSENTVDPLSMMEAGDMARDFYYNDKSFDTTLGATHFIEYDSSNAYWSLNVVGPSNMEITRVIDKVFFYKSK